jgi:hypothetical protein
MAINGFSKASAIQKKLPHLSTTQIVQKLYAIKKSDPKFKLTANDTEASTEDGKKICYNLVSRKRKALNSIPLGPVGGELDEADGLDDLEEDLEESIEFPTPAELLSSYGILKWFEGDSCLVIWVRYVPGIKIKCGPVHPFEVEFKIMHNNPPILGIPGLSEEDCRQISHMFKNENFFFSIPSGRTLGTTSSNGSRQYLPSEEDKKWIVYQIQYELESLTIFKDE